MLRSLVALMILACVFAAHAQVQFEYAGSFEAVKTARVTGDYRRAEILMPIPLSGPMQTISNLVVEPANTQLLLDEENELCLARLEIKEPGTSATLSVRYGVNCHPPRYDMQALAARVYPEYDTTSDLYRKFTGNSKDIAADDPAIAAIGERLARDIPHPVARARAAYDTVMQSCTYMRDRPLDASRMLQQRVGNCMAYSNLFVALCRAAGIPARVCGGAVIGEKDPWHQWAEFYLPEVGWIPCDPTNGDENPDVSDRFFGGFGGKPVVVTYKGHGFTLKQGDTAREVGHVAVGSVTWTGTLTHQFDFAATRVSPVRYCILFQAGRPASTVEMDLTEAQITAALSSAREQGRQCIALSPAFRPDGLRYGVIWCASDDPNSWVAYPRLSRDQLSSLAVTARNNGLMPVGLASCVSESGDEVFAAVFAPDQGTEWVLLSALPGDDFLAELRNQTQARRIPAAIAAHTRAGQPVVSGLFATINQSFSVQTSLWNQGADFDALLETQRGKGAMPVAVAVTDALPPYYHVVCLTTGAANDWWIARDVTSEQMASVLEAASGRGLQAVGISAY